MWSSIRAESSAARCPASRAWSASPSPPWSKRTGEPVDTAAFPDDGAWIDYNGPAGTIEEVSFSDVLNGNFEPGAFRDKIVVIGGTALTLQDTHPTSSTRGDEVMAGPEVQANAIDTVRDGLPLKSTPGALDVSSSSSSPSCRSRPRPRLSPLRAFLSRSRVAAVYLGLVQLAFNGPGRLLPVIYPLGALVVSSVATLGLQYVSASVDRERVRGVFTRFVPDRWSSRLWSRRTTTCGSGRRTVCTVLFSDIRGFTTFSENNSPREVVDVLNRYLEEMSDAIFAHGGTITAYIGDGIMAVFGAPIPQDDHADRAVAARARCSTSACRASIAGSPSGAWRSSGSGSGSTAARSCTGTSAPTSGSTTRRSATPVNTAARLEGMTKDSGHQILVAETTYERLGDQQGLAYVDELEVRGRAAKLKVWAPNGAVDD